MSRRKVQPMLPTIAVENEMRKVRLEVPEELHHRLEEYARYFHSASGRKPLTMNHVIVGLLESYLNADALFVKWRGEHRNGFAQGESPFAADRHAVSAGE